MTTLEVRHSPGSQKHDSPCTSDQLLRLRDHEKRLYSQNGEDGIIARLFELLGTTNRYYVEFGTGTTGAQRNTRLLDQSDWTGLLMDLGASERAPNVKKERITAENINQLFAKYDVPLEFDLLSIDIDGNDYWVRKAIGRNYLPRVLVMEYNASFPPPQSKTITYDPNFYWRKTNYFGASLTALMKLNASFGYRLVFCDSRGINAFFIREDLVPQGFTATIEDIYRPVDFAGNILFGLGGIFWPMGVGHKSDPHRQMIDV